MWTVTIGGRNDSYPRSEFHIMDKEDAVNKFIELVENICESEGINPDKEPHRIKKEIDIPILEEWKKGGISCLSRVLTEKHKIVMFHFAPNDGTPEKWISRKGLN